MILHNIIQTKLKTKYSKKIKYQTIKNLNFFKK